MFKVSTKVLNSIACKMAQQWHSNQVKSNKMLQYNIMAFKQSISFISSINDIRMPCNIIYLPNVCI
jgi:hypothetical protein